MDELSVGGSQRLPVWLSQFFGRQDESAELARLIEDVRLLTLVGAPGSGKTRLSVELAGEVGPRFAGGVRFVELAPLTDPAQVARAVGAAASIAERPGEPMVDTLVEALAEVDVLLVLDNCEHLARAPAELTRYLLGACPSVRVLATSRVPLGLTGEQVWNVPPLGSEPAFELFSDRARRVSNGFELDADGEARVREICERLDGLPLAIELAAAWARALSPSEIADRLDSALSLLRSRGAHGASPRQVTMEATVDWSYRLLEPAGQLLFDRLSVFAGGFDLRAAGAVSGLDDGVNRGQGDGDLLARLAALVDHSLVLADQATSGDSMRYHLLEPVRQCGAAKLADRGETEMVRQRHAEHYLDVARRCDATFRGDRRADALRRLEQEEGNLLVALEWTRAQRSDLGLRLCAALGNFWELRGRVNDGQAHLLDMLSVATGDRDLRATALARAGKLAWRQRDYVGARRFLDESIAIKHELGDTLGVARRLRSLALVAFNDGDLSAAAELGERAVATFRLHEDEQGLVWALIFAGFVRYLEGDLPEGDACFEEVSAINGRVGSAAVTAYSSFCQGFAANRAGDVGAERAHLVRAVGAMQEAGGFVEEPDWLGACALLAVSEGRFRSALRLAGGAEAQSSRSGSYVNEAVMVYLEPRLDRAHQEIGLSSASRLKAEGARMSAEELLAEALSAPGEGDREDSDQPLTPREQEVAELVGQGLTNVEIAQKLFISRRTVESHVDHIKQKLLLGSRQQVMAWALRKDPSNPDP